VTIYGGLFEADLSQEKCDDVLRISQGFLSVGRNHVGQPPIPAPRDDQKLFSGNLRMGQMYQALVAPFCQSQCQFPAAWPNEAMPGRLDDGRMRFRFGDQQPEQADMVWMPGERVMLQRYGEEK